MGESEENENRDLWKSIAPDFNLSALDDLEVDGVNIQCVNSSDFVVGRQTNFNGPVTIINCENGFTHRPSETMTGPESEKEEKLVIRNKVLSESAAKRMQEMAAKNTMKNGTEQFSHGAEEKVRYPILGLCKNYVNCQNGIFITLAVILICAAVTSALVFIKSTVKDKEVMWCDPSTKQTDKICIYKNFEWGGRPNEEKTFMETPVPYVVVSQTQSDSCFDYNFCVDTVKWIQTETTLLCNFFVGGDGNVYEDRGWNMTNSLTGPAANKSAYICLLGASFDYPTYPQIEAAKDLIKFGVQNQYVSEKYLLTTLNATAPDLNISSNVYRIVKSWPKFRTNPFEIEGEDLLDEGYITYSKKDWGGLPPKSVIEMKLPIPYVVISHSVTVQCFDFDTCVPLVRQMQSYHQSLNFADIAYNFLVDSSGNIYEGRGWTKRNVAGGFINGRNIDINLIGDFSQSAKPTTKQLNGVKYLIQYGLEKEIISKKYSLLSANTTFETLSPGKNVYEIIKEWPHFDPEPEAHVGEYD